MNRTKMGKLVTARISDALLQAANETSRRTDIPVALVIREAIRQWVAGRWSPVPIPSDAGEKRAASDD